MWLVYSPFLLTVVVIVEVVALLNSPSCPFSVENVAVFVVVMTVCEPSSFFVTVV